MGCGGRYGSGIACCHGCGFDGEEEEDDGSGWLEEEKLEAGMMGSSTEGWKGNEMEVDQAPRPRAAEVSVPEALVRCSPPMTGLKMAPTSGTLL